MRQMLGAKSVVIAPHRLYRPAVARTTQRSLFTLGAVRDEVADAYGLAHGAAWPRARRTCRQGPVRVSKSSMIVVTFFVVLIPYRDNSPKLTRSFTALPRRTADGVLGDSRAALKIGASGSLASLVVH